MKTKIVATLLAIVGCAYAAAQARIHTFDLSTDIDYSAWTTTQRALSHAQADDAQCVIVRLNTYGGMLAYGDSIRTAILNSAVPVYALIDNKAVSAGALIAIACDSIYMTNGAIIGASTVVDIAGTRMPEKYQSVMRSMMRSTAEAKGKRTISSPSGNDTTVWRRNPAISQGMVDEAASADGKLITLTTAEAQENGYCEAIFSNIDEVAQHVAQGEYTITRFEESRNEQMISMLDMLLNNKMMQIILIAVMFFGIVVSVASPGSVTPIAVTVGAAALFFISQNIAGYASGFEIILFVAGIALLLLEALVVPGFGITGIAGIIAVLASLTLSLVDNDGLDFSSVTASDIAYSLLKVVVTLVASIAAAFVALRYFMKGESKASRRFTLQTSQHAEEGYVGVDTSLQSLVGQSGTTQTPLRPGGKVRIGNTTYDAIAACGFIEKDTNIVVADISTSQLVVDKA